MTDAITPEERVSIEHAIAAGRVRVIPTGVSGEETWLWDAKRKRIVAPDGEKWTPWGRKKRTP